MESGWRELAARDAADVPAPRLPTHLVAPPATDAPDRNWALWRWVELRGIGIEPLLDLATPNCAAAAERVVAREQDILRHRGAVLDAIKAELAVAPAPAKPALRRGRS